MEQNPTAMRAWVCKAGYGSMNLCSQGPMMIWKVETRVYASIPRKNTLSQPNVNYIYTFKVILLTWLHSYILTHTILTERKKTDGGMDCGDI